jgi:hypothetical protein
MLLGVEIRLLSQQLSDVMAICRDNVKDMYSLVQQQLKQVTLIDAIGNYKQVPFEYCLTYEVRTDSTLSLLHPSNMVGRCLRTCFTHIISIKDNQDTTLS